MAGFLAVAACTPVQQLQNVAAAGGALASSVTGAGAQNAAFSGAELRQLQTREFATSKAGAFASVMNVLLDSGYRILSADMESGLITAAGSSTGRLRLDPAGVARTTQTPMASAYVEERGADAARVRIVFSVGTSATGQLGSSGEKAVMDQGVYASFFSRLAEEIEQRPKATQSAPPSQAPGEPSSEAGGEAAQAQTAAANADAASEAASAEPEPDASVDVEDEMPEDQR